MTGGYLRCGLQREKRRSAFFQLFGVFEQAFRLEDRDDAARFRDVQERLPTATLEDIALKAERNGAHRLLPVTLEVGNRARVHLNH